MKDNFTIKYSKLSIVFFIMVVFSITLFFTSFSQSFAMIPNAKNMFSGTTTVNKEIQEKLYHALLNQRFMENVQSRYDAMNAHKIFQKKIRDFPAGEKIAAFLKTLKHAENKGIDTHSVLKSLDLQKNKISMALLPGSIEGTVTLEGMPPYGGSIEVLAFDTFGYYAGSGYVDYYSGYYTITDLAPGDYYIVTNSWYVDEFYNNVMRDFFRNWRQATLVTVYDGSVTSGIDFDLQEGAKVTGYLYDATENLPLSYYYMNFEISSATIQETLFEPYGYTDYIGFYQITLPFTGSFKIKASVYDFASEYYNEKEDWASADPITVASLDDSIPNVNFTLEQMVPSEVEGATIQGFLTGPGESPVNMGFVFAFNTADTSIAGLAISGADSGQGEYAIMGLQPGSYILYANHYLDMIAPPETAVQGEYYQNAATPEDAEKIIITEQTEIISDKNFVLDPGGGISGSIKDANEAPLDSVIILAIKTDIVIDDKFFIDEIDFGLGISDESGNYAILGLTAGDYILRTISLLTKHAGLVVDEYYENVQSIYDFDESTPVTVGVPDITSNIDFMLAFAGGISGNFFEADGITPVMGEGTVIAFNAETDLPELAISLYNAENGSYQIRPLANGNYKLLALVTSEGLGIEIAPLGKKTFQKTPLYSNRLQQEDEIIYVPQFYNGEYNFEDADVIAVTAPLSTPDIDFKMVRTGAIQGFVYYQPETTVGADILSETTVAAFDAISGELRGGANVTFTGGYRIYGLPPGAYKVVAWPAAEGYAATYYGGGVTFDDQNSLGILVTPEEETRADIELVEGSGSISGMVYNEDGSLTLDGILVLAYDQTGHAVSGGMSGIDMVTKLPSNPGAYSISGLISGTYYVRTFSLINLLALLDMENGSSTLGENGMPDLDEIQIYGDLWYDNEPVELNLDISNLFALIFNLLYMQNEDMPLFMPFYSVPPAEADLVNVISPNETPDINFYLPLIDFSLLLNLPVITENDQMPNSFQLSQNYPNPFNPGTTIEFALPKAAHVKLDVYNALGQKVATLLNHQLSAGDYNIQFEAKNLASGIYYYKIEADKFQHVKRMILVK